MAIAGSETRLCTGVKLRTWKWWRETGRVPAYRLLPILLDEYRRHGGGDGKRASAPTEDPELAQLLEDVRRIYGSGHQEVVLTLRQNLHVFLLAIKQDGRRKKWRSVRRLGARGAAPGEGEVLG